MADEVTVIVTVRVVVKASTWATEYGMTDAEAREDIVDRLPQIVDEGVSQHPLHYLFHDWSTDTV